MPDRLTLEEWLEETNLVLPVANQIPADEMPPSFVSGLRTRLGQAERALRAFVKAENDIDNALEPEQQAAFDSFETYMEDAINEEEAGDGR